MGYLFRAVMTFNYSSAYAKVNDRACDVFGLKVLHNAVSGLAPHTRVRGFVLN
jgi:hypothetical protein